MDDSMRDVWLDKLLREREEDQIMIPLTVRLFFQGEQIDEKLTVPVMLMLDTGGYSFKLSAAMGRLKHFLASSHPAVDTEGIGHRALLVSCLPYHTLRTPAHKYSKEYIKRCPGMHRQQTLAERAKDTDGTLQVPGSAADPLFRDAREWLEKKGKNLEGWRLICVLFSFP